MTEETAGDIVLSLEGITRRFGSVVALDQASLRVRAGTVHAVLGENGAGKTTLMRVAFGLLQPQAGTVRVRGVSQVIASPSVALSLGIGMVHQHFTLVPAMSVAENVALGGRGRFDPRAAAERVRTVSTRAGLTLDPEAMVSTLSVGAQQRCEIVKALARDVQLLILDEPTAVLAPSEAQELLQWMRRHADAGHAVVLITHKLRDALAIADDVTVLRHGRTVMATRASETDEAGLASAMLGQESTTDDAMHVASPIAASSGEPVFAARNLRVSDARGVARVRGATMHVHGGEIVGIAAVEGEGQHELLRVFAGRGEPSSGDLTRPPVVGFVPEDRHRDALMLDATLVENVALRGAGARRGRVAWGALREETRAIVDRYAVRTSGVLSAARTMSGGNQQKLVLGREMSGAPSALVVENPSRGLDFRATSAVRDALRAARDGGAAVLLYSSDLDELLLLADRVYAMHNGMLTEVSGDRDAVGRAMLGSPTARA